MLAAETEEFIYRSIEAGSKITQQKNTVSRSSAKDTAIALLHHACPFSGRCKLQTPMRHAPDNVCNPLSRRKSRKKAAIVGFKQATLSKQPTRPQFIA